MRLAICVGSVYDQSPSLPQLSGAALDLEVISERLAQPDAGFTVHAFSAMRGLAEGIEQLIESLDAPLETLVVYFSGYVLLSEERGPALLLDGERIGTLSLNRLSKIVQRYAQEAALLLDLVSHPDTLHGSLEVARAVNAALSGTRASAITAVRPAAAASQAELAPFTNLLRMVLDWRDPQGSLSLAALWAGVQSEPLSFEEIPAIDFLPGPSDPLLVPSPVARDSLAPGAEPATQRPTSLFPSSSPQLRSYVAEADALANRDELQAALDHYEGARLQLSAEPGAEHVRLYEKIGTVLRRTERFEDARAYFEAALAIDPDALRSLEGVTDLSLELGDVARARAWLERWVAIESTSVIAIERLLALQLAAGEHVLALETRRQLAHAVSDPQFAAEQLYAAALCAEEVVGDPVRAIALHEEALAFAPSSADVLQRVELLLEQRHEYARLATIYEFSLERATSHELAQALARRLAELCRGQLKDSSRAARALARAAELEPGNHALFAELSLLFVNSGDHPRAAELARRAIAADPKVEYLRLARRALERAGDADAAWNAANALDWLGEADLDESLAAGQHRPEGLLLVQGNLSETDWAAGHLSGDVDPSLVELLGALRPGIVELAITTAKKSGLAPDLELGSEQDLGKSTTTLAKTLLWASRLLAVQTPKLYVMPEVNGELVGQPCSSPVSLASRLVGSGLGLSELAFLWGRHLVQFRREHELSLFFPNAADQEAMLLAALAVGGAPEQGLRSLDGSAKRFAIGLKKHLRGINVDYVKDIVRRQPLLEPNARMRAYRARAERTALRAGLLACGDIAIAARMSERFPSGRELTPSEQQAELITFSISAPYGQMRRRLGVAILA